MFVPSVGIFKFSFLVRSNKQLKIKLLQLPATSNGEILIPISLSYLGIRYSYKLSEHFQFLLRNIVGEGAKDWFPYPVEVQTSFCGAGPAGELEEQQGDRRSSATTGNFQILKCSVRRTNQQSSREIIKSKKVVKSNSCWDMHTCIKESRRPEGQGLSSERTSKNKGCSTMEFLKLSAPSFQTKGIYKACVPYTMCLSYTAQYTIHFKDRGLHSAFFKFINFLIHFLKLGAHTPFGVFYTTYTTYTT